MKGESIPCPAPCARMMAVSKLILGLRRRGHDELSTLEVFLNGLAQPFRDRQTRYLKNIPDMLTEQRIKDGIIVTREIISKPPHPVAAFRYKQLFIGKIPTILRNAAFLIHQCRSCPDDPSPRLMIFPMTDPHTEIRTRTRSL